MKNTEPSRREFLAASVAIASGLPTEQPKEATLHDLALSSTWIAGRESAPVDNSNTLYQSMTTNK